MLSDFARVSPPAPLVSLAEAKTWYGITDTVNDVKLTLALEAVSDLLRGYLGRYLTAGDYSEKFPVCPDIRQTSDHHYVYLREYPLISLASGAELVNSSTGLVEFPAGQEDPVLYNGGYAVLPAVIQMIFFELVRQQMSALGVSPLGTSYVPEDSPTKAVTVGSLKVEYAVTAVRVNEVTGYGGLTIDALKPYESSLAPYRSNKVFS